jgi:HD superfamily phosphohydrolase
VDIEYLLSQIALDEEQRICFQAKGLRAAEHLLVCRYFDYQQVAFNKTVAGLEWVLREVLAELFQQEKMSCSAKWVENAIQSQDPWCEFDDGLVLERIRALNRESKAGSDIALLAEAILQRTPAKLVGEIEYIRGRTKQDKNDFLLKRKTVRDEVKKLAEEFGIPERLWHVWSRPGIALTKVGSYVPISEARESSDTEADKEDEYEQAIRLLDQNGRTSKPIMAIPYSLMSVLADRALYMLRVYVVLPRTPGRQEVVTKICNRIAKIQHLEWK